MNIQEKSQPSILQRSLRRKIGAPASYGLAILLVATAVAITSLILPYFTLASLVMVYLLAVIVAAIYLGRGPSILASILGVLAFDFFHVQPYLTLIISKTEDFLTFIGLFIVSLVVSELTNRVREQAERAEQREVDTATQLSLSRDLAAATNIDAILQALTTHIQQILDCRVILFLPEEQLSIRTEPSRLRPLYLGDQVQLSAEETTQAGETYEKGRIRLPEGDTLSNSEPRFLPLLTSNGIAGVLEIRSNCSLDLLPDQDRILQAFAHQAAQSIERIRLAERANQVQVMRQTEKLQTALLNSISHDLRTPLVTITGALSTLKDRDAFLDEEARTALADTGFQEAERLNRMVGNLLNMTRLEAGTVKVIKQPCDVQDVIGSALEQLKEPLRNYPVNVDFPAEILPVPMDFVLIVQVLVNLIDNAIKYSPEGSPIDIKARTSGAFLEIEIADRGIGIPSEDLTRIFDKFYRVNRKESASGTGLGLSICKGIAEAHGGFISAENREGGGTIFSLALPVE